MLGGTGMKMLFSLKLLGELGIKKGPLPRYVRWGWCKTDSFRRSSPVMPKRSGSNQDFNHLSFLLLIS